jgi:hypothetical protein
MSHCRLLAWNGFFGYSSPFMDLFSFGEYPLSSCNDLGSSVYYFMPLSPDRIRVAMGYSPLKNTCYQGEGGTLITGRHILAPS